MERLQILKNRTLASFSNGGNGSFVQEAGAQANKTTLLIAIPIFMLLKLFELITNKQRYAEELEMLFELECLPQFVNIRSTTLQMN